ncbi:MAG: hypothetical protein GY854_30290 [Deltaproteobacteria bacterium]|nr:hypothetical protein [Deltaproteobacteria bacterium]
MNRFEHTDLEYAEQEIRKLKKDLELWKEIAEDNRTLVQSAEEHLGCENLGDWLHEREMENATTNV